MKTTRSIVLALALPMLSSAQTQTATPQPKPVKVETEHVHHGASHTHMHTTAYPTEHQSTTSWHYHHGTKRPQVPVQGMEGTETTPLKSSEKATNATK